MRVIFIGCVRSSQMLLNELLSMADVVVVGIATKSTSSENADFCSLEPLGVNNNIPVFNYAAGKEELLVKWASELNADVVYCFGWSHILPKEMITLCPKGAIGYHPSLLPNNRGRHPIIWTLVLGLDVTGSTYFFMDEGADSGDILDQEIVGVSLQDDAATLYEKLMSVAILQLIRLTKALIAGNYDRRPQDCKSANNWRKRKKKDGEIDWRMSATCINNLIRALVSPYPGAHCLYEGSEIKIWKSRIIKGLPQNIEPGKIIFSDGESIIVKCGEDAIEILEHDFPDNPVPGSYL